MDLELKAPFSFGPGVGREDKPQPVRIEFSDGQVVTFYLKPFVRSMFAKLESAGFDPDPFATGLSPVEDFERDKFIAKELIVGWEPGISRTDGSVWVYEGPDDAEAIAGHAGAMSMVKVAAMKLVLGQMEEREGNSESGSGTTTGGELQSEAAPNAEPAGSVS